MNQWPAICVVAGVVNSTLHVDAYTGYDAVYLGYNSGMVEVVCWAHAHRKFFDARHN